jgi:hypothetical protein
MNGTDRCTGSKVFMRRYKYDGESGKIHKASEKVHAIGLVIKAWAFAFVFYCSIAIVRVQLSA